MRKGVLMKIRLDKDLVTRLYYLTFQAERSLDKTLGNGWMELRNYYLGDRIVAVEDLLHDVEELLSRQGVSLGVGSQEEINRQCPSLGLFRYLFGRWLARWQRHWSFPGQEVGFMASNLRSFLRLLDSDVRPEQSVLISLRMALCLSRSLIEIRCYGLPVLGYGNRIEHLYQSDWYSPVHLADILGERPLQFQEGRG
jgi:hypothetical protein